MEDPFHFNIKWKYIAFIYRLVFLGVALFEFSMISCENYLVNEFILCQITFLKDYYKDLLGNKNPNG